jgi:4-amino-4-deoxy-L-arabinose transferase-like glycosyltransferase
MRRTMHVLQTGSPQEDGRFYDHPYFGQLLLAGIFWLIGYPSSINPSVSDSHSIEALYVFPRILMGFFAVVDTLLIFKISERRYNRNVAFIASTLFAVMPITCYLLRWILLDSIQLPFILSSILFADYTHDYKGKVKVTTTLLSGVSLGLSIFTKIPAFAMIPLVGFLIYKNNKKNRGKLIALWFVPVVMIPMLWPLYSIWVGQFNYWLDGISYQTHRQSQLFFASLNLFLRDDPILLVAGIVGMIFAATKPDYFLLLWIIPFLIFLYFIGWVMIYHFIPLIPALCIAAARLIVDLPKKINNRKLQQLIPFIIISAIAIFGIVKISTLIIPSTNSFYYKAAAFLSQFLETTEHNNINNRNNRGVTVIADALYLWIPQYVFHLPAIYKTYFDKPSVSPQIILIDDPGFRKVLSGNDIQAKLLRDIFNLKGIHKISTFQSSLKYKNASIYTR